MEGISNVQSVGYGQSSPHIASPTGIQGGSQTGGGAPGASGELGGAKNTQGLGGQSALSLSASMSSTQITQNVESFVATYGPVMSSNEMLGAVLLLLTLELMQSQDDEQKKGLLAAISTLAQMQQQDQGGGMFMYSSSSTSIESTQMTLSADSMAAGAYGGGGAGTTAGQVAPQVDGGSQGLDVSA
jgi:hypothetical protein